MPIPPDRRQTLALLATSCLAALFPAAAALAEPAMGDLLLGDEAAPVTVIEYASFTCSHCAHFHENSWARLKADYIDTGKVKFTLREVYFDKYGLWASMAARCGGEPAFYPMATQLLKKQKVWMGVPESEIVGEIRKIGRLNGLSDEQFNACLQNQDYAKTLLESYKTNATADGVTGTPTFFVNGKKVDGDKPGELFGLIESQL